MMSVVGNSDIAISQPDRQNLCWPPNSLPGRQVLHLAGKFYAWRANCTPD